MQNNIRLVLGLTIGLLSIVCSTTYAQSLWTGYINDKTFEDKTYGYLFSSSISNDDRKIRLVCYAPDTFTLYLPTNQGKLKATGTVRLVVDSLPEVNLAIQPDSEGISISNESAQFWPLIAQMVIGGRLSTYLPDEKSPVQFNLTGFTNAYTEMCGWIESSNSYNSHLEIYRRLPQQ